MPPSSSRRRFALGLGCAGLVAASAARPEPVRHAWPRGVPAPPLALSADGGAPWRLADARGRVVVLNFWASWCEPCRAELPSLELLAQRHEQRGLLVLTVNFRETDAALRRFLDATALTLPVLRDRDGAAARAWQVRTYPTTFVIGRDGRVVFSVVGEADWTAEPTRHWISSLL